MTDIILEIMYEDEDLPETLIITDRNIDNSISKDSEIAIKTQDAKIGDIITLSSGIKFKLISKK